jgi:hypothetical protein
VTDESRPRNECLFASEIIPLYRTLRDRSDSLEAPLLGLLDRIERLLYERLSIEEIEAIADMSDAGVAELGKKL